ncbi:hypothetical protein Mhun_1660 [Methanospirillum hungatei JF-1]|jgi:hypothetical protein|uniref:Uncharacterized protein n=1 Tax=Methanospirillum hungatei JF-1 (strain ATCC 27890 / DSM 864 / NBRC 100397 / JF-1) TaxID=323259 RepID=Q2FL09_METHJ|nr:hypothetical protein [Methanospirillum hungatei]ABD41391.1 hypothetical protein Mhun_1660 [Methanospirillum hungatei JF-1]
MTEGRTRGQGNNPGVTKRKIIEIILKQSEPTPEPLIRDSIASDLGIKEPKSTKIQLAAAKEEGILLKDTRSGVNYWDIDFTSEALLGYVIDIITLMPGKDRVPFFSSLYVQDLVLKMAGFLARTNHPKTRVGYYSTKLSEYWGFLKSEPIHETLDEELPDDVLRAVRFYQWVVTRSPSFFLYSFQDAAQIDPFLESILASYIHKAEWRDFDLLYFVGTMGLIIDYSRADERYRDEIAAFLGENSRDIFNHTSIKYPDRLFRNMIQAHEMMQERHTIPTTQGGSQKAFRTNLNMFEKL